MSIKCAADFADWYDTTARNYTDEVLTEFVDRNPNLIGVWAAAGAANAFEIGSIVFVDLGRFGSGFGSGTTGGVFQDLLRALSVIPVGKVASTVGAIARPALGRFLNTAAQFYWAAKRGKLCVPISIGQALERTGQSLVMTLDDVLKAAGRSIESFDSKLGRGMLPAEVRETLEAMQAKFSELPARIATSWSDIVGYAQGTEGLLMVSIKRTVTKGGKLADTFHTILVSNSPQGVVIVDRYGLFKSLEELSVRYGSRAPSEFYRINVDKPIFAIANWVMDSALVSRLNAMGPLGAIAVRAAMMIGFNPAVPRAQVDEMFTKFTAGKSPEELYSAPVRPPEMAATMFTHEIGARIERKDWLSVISEKWYGDLLLWPIIFDFNRSAEFPHPKQMKPYMRIKVPFLPEMTKEQRIAVRQRGLNWK